MMNTAEEWRKIAASPDYEVSASGDVRSLKSGSPRPLKPWLVHDGYRLVGLCDANKVRHIKIAVLVCSAFHGPRPSPAHLVAHGDGVRTNDNKNNLRWATHAENEEDKERHGNRPRGAKHGSARLSEDDVRAIRSRSLAGETCRAIAADYDLDYTTVWAIKARRNWKHVP